MIVVPYIGTWIETFVSKKRTNNNNVVPYIGTWIETLNGKERDETKQVVPYIGTWIETKTKRPHYHLLLSYLI